MRYKKPVQLCLPLEYPAVLADKHRDVIEFKREMNIAGFVKPKEYVPMIGAYGQVIVNQQFRKR